MKEAVEFAFAHTKKGAVCLLSSASPSYSLWRNWDEKGEEFKKYIEHYATKIS
jgi:UDP-N-acetylmuramoylalanine-D-glutamate ligase